MNLYRNRVEAALRLNNARLRSLERHKDFYPLLEELQDVFGREFYPCQSISLLTVTVYLQDNDDKTLPLLIEEFIKDKDWLEEAEPSSSNKEYGEYRMAFYIKKRQFGSGDRPKLVLSINYSNLCKRVVSGTRVVKDYEYKCD